MSKIKRRVLVVDDDSNIRDSLEMILQYENYGVMLAGNGEEALRALKDGSFDLVLLDIKMPGKSGLEILETIKQRYPHTAVVMISAHGTVHNAVEATKKGAFDFIEKPLDRDRLLLTLRNAFSQRELTQQVQDLKAQVSHKDKFIGESAGVKQVLDLADRVALTDARVLISGENGTGKELIARRIHLNSLRRQGAFVDVNCAAIPKELIESELFGHEKGSFTGAEGRKIGKFEMAHKGSIFLDEVGDMDLSAQAKVLRVLEENKIQRVGGTGDIPIDVRVIAATNKELKMEVEAGQFREDLFYRLNVVPILLPPLRERREDISQIVAYFLAEFCKKNNLPLKRMTSGAIGVLEKQEWPGNVRELRNLIERLVVLLPGESIEEKDLHPVLTAPPATNEDVFTSCDSFEDFKVMAERMFLKKKLAENDWNVKKTAEALKMQRSNLYKKIEKFRLK